MNSTLKKKIFETRGQASTTYGGEEAESINGLVKAKFFLKDLVSRNCTLGRANPEIGKGW